MLDGENRGSDPLLTVHIGTISASRWPHPTMLYIVQGAPSDVIDYSPGLFHQTQINLVCSSGKIFFAQSPMMECKQLRSLTRRERNRFGLERGVKGRSHGLLVVNTGPLYSSLYHINR